MLFSALVAALGATVAIAASTPYVPGKAFDRFFTIWLENQDYDRVIKNSYIKGLVKEGILLSNYIAHTHPSQPNYIASIAGDYFGLNHDDVIHIPENITTVVDLLDSRDISWKGYFEGIPGPGYMNAASTAKDGSGWDYVSKHNPFVSFDSITFNGTRLANIRSFADFDDDLKKNELPQFAHMSPNMMNDGHNTTLEYAAVWTDTYVRSLLKEEEFMKNTLLLVTYDESETYSQPNKIASILLGGAIPKNKRGTTDETFYTHYSILSTLQNNWELPNLGRYDVGANVFDIVAQKTGYKNHHPSSVAPLNNSLSYAGALNNLPDKWKAYPTPNMQLIGAGGKGIERTTKLNWVTREKDTTPYDGTGQVFDGGNGISDLNMPFYKAQAPAPNITYPPHYVVGGKNSAGRLRGFGG
ncbi:hypothetical protein HYFRA_00000150, partial [Hymenoscyphus fraxineus]